MLFIEPEDYTVQIRNEVRQIVAPQSAQLDQAEQFAQSEMEGYLRVRYDVANIFNKTGGDRHPVVVMYAIDIALYHLHANISPRNVPQLRTDRYEAAINWLKMVARGTLSPDLPPLSDEGGSYFFRGGSNKKYSTRW